MSDKPKSFEDLKPTELYRSAIEDFALPVEVEDKNKKKVLLAAFLEGGVTWKDYVDQHPEVAPSEEEVQEAALKDSLASGQVITSNAPSHNTVDSAPGAVEPENKWDEEKEETVEEVIVAKPLDTNTTQKYLIKMVRDNPLYETRGYRFTKEHPYNLVSAEDAEYMLTKEDGFRQATPSELQEFYG